MLTLISSSVMQAQLLNDDCFVATAIPSTDNYCSEIAEFSNVGASMDPNIGNSCLFTFINGVWFSFIPTEPAVNIRVFGTEDTGATLSNAKIGVFEGSCNNLSLVSCSPGTTPGSSELTFSGIVIGQRYFIYVESSVAGTFRLCINDFIAPPSPEADCVEAVVLCDKSSFVVENLNTAGNFTNEFDNLAMCSEDGIPCIDVESNSSWYVWTCKDPGTLTFTLTPGNFNGTALNENAVADDIDFLVLEYPGGIGDCNNKQVIRCMASGQQGGSPLSAWVACTGETGLREGDGDMCEFRGCQPGSGNNNFVDAINMVAGTTYGVMIMNFDNTGLGFAIEFGGTGTFEGPEPDFEATLPTAEQIFECDKTIIFEDNSDSTTDPIVDWEWNFGVGADMPFAVGQGPHNIVYESFGAKIVALTVTSQRGCEVTKILDLFVEPCCADINTLGIDATGIDIICAGEATGQIDVMGIAGDPQYQFSINGAPFLPNTTYVGLEAGDYIIEVQDTKGCINETMVTIFEPLALEVTASEDQTIQLGNSTNINSTTANGTGNLTYMWSPCEGLSCCDCPNPSVFPTDDINVYTIIVIDENGCEVRDQLTITTEFDPSFYAPNIFSPNGDGINEFFNVFAGIEAESEYELMIYDRWGNLIYDNNNVPLNDLNSGWNGRFETQLVDSGVFAWIAKIKYINDTSIFYTGDVTVAR